MSYLVVSSSLNPESRSRVLAQDALKALKDTGVETQWLDLSEYSLPLCDGHSAYDEPQVQEVKAFVHKAEGILLAAPIYNFDASAAAKNLIELTGASWSEKVVGFLCAAGGQGSYMSIMSLASSLMLDFRCLVIPRFIYATGESFEESKVSDPKIQKRILELAQQLHRICQALKD